MNTTELRRKLQYYRDIIDELEKNTLEAIDGTLRVSVDGKKVRYYQYFGEGEKERYIHADEIDIARTLAQRDYNERVFKLAKKRLNQITRLLKDYDENEIDELYEKLHPVRKNLITPIMPTTNQKYAEWRNLQYQGKDFYEGLPIILTEKGERVRSKSEKILADYFYKNNIEYKYEKPLRLKGVGTVYPDFTFFSKKLGEEIYWEHDGRMDDSEYARKAIRKISAYESNGIYLGKKLIVTFETTDKVLSTKEIEGLVSRLLK